MARLLNFHHRLQYPVDALPGLGRNEQQGRVGQKRKLASDLRFIDGHRVGIFLHDIPFVHQKNEADILVDQQTRDVGIL